MPAIIDQDEIDHAVSQLQGAAQKANPAVKPEPTIAPTGGPILDPDELAHIQAQISGNAQSVIPPNLTNLPPIEGQTVQAQPEKTWLGRINDVMHMGGSGVPFADRISAAVNTATGTGLPGADYAKNLQNERWKNQQLRSDYPTLSKVMPFIGGSAAVMATAPASVLAGPTMVGRTVGSAATGGAYGALQGASETPNLTNLPDTAKNVATGMGIGALTGAAIPIASKAIGAGVENTANAITGGVDGVSRRAAKHLLPAIEADTPQAVGDTLNRLGPQGMLADSGPAMLGKAQGAALNSEEGRSILTNALKTRDAGTLARVNQDIDTAMGPAASPMQITNAIKGARSYEHQALPSIFAAAPEVDTSSVLSTIGQSLTKAVGPEASLLGRARDYLMTSKPKLDAAGNPVLDAAGNEVRVAAPVKDAETLQNAKMAIDKLIDYGDPQLGIPPGAISKAQGAVSDVRKKLNDELRNQVPGYSDVMDNSSRLARKVDAIESGMKDVLRGGDSAMHPADLAARISGAGPEMTEGLKIGTRSAIDNAVGTKANDLLALKNELQIGPGQGLGPPSWNQEKLAQIWGQPPVDALTNSVNRNLAFKDTVNKVVENSQTAQRNAAAAAMKPGASMGGIPYINPNMTFTGALATPVKGMANALMRQFKADPTRAYGEIASILSAQGASRDAYYSALADTLMRRNRNAVIAQSAGNKAAIAAALVGGRYANDQMLPPAAKVIQP